MGKRRNPTESNVPQTRKRVEVKARNIAQKDYLRAIRSNDITFGIGSAGTGKTYLAAKIAQQMFTDGEIGRIIICRPAVEAAGERLGFLPGGINDKMDPYIRPIFDAFLEYWSMKTIRDYMTDGRIEIVPLAYMRGRTFSDAFIIADEMQNAKPEQLLMLVTRLGEDSKMVITGDPIQSDVGSRSCFGVAESILGEVEAIEFVQFNNSDVVRHPTVERILDVWPNNGMNLDDDPDDNRMNGVHRTIRMAPIH